MSIYSESLHRSVEGREKGSWVPLRGIVMVDMRDGFLDDADIKKLLETRDVGIIQITDGDEHATWNPDSPIQTLSLSGRSLESLIAGIQPDVLVSTGYDDKRIDKSIPRPKQVNPIHTGENTVSYITRDLSLLDRDDNAHPKTAKERWLGSADGAFAGVRGLSLVESPTDTEGKEHWLRKWLDESDIALAQIGFFAGVLLMGSEHAETFRSVVQNGAYVASVLGTMSLIGENTSASQSWKEFWRAGKRVTGFLASSVVGAKLGTMLSAVEDSVFGNGSEFLYQGEVVTSEFYEDPTTQGTVLPDPHHGEIVRDVPTVTASPIMDWKHLPDFFHEQLGENDWENPENGVNLSEVMADHVLENHGDMEAVQETLDRMQETTSYNDYRLLRNAGQIY